MIKQDWRVLCAASVVATGFVVLGSSGAGATVSGPYTNGTMFIADQSCPCVWEVPPGGSSSPSFFGAFTESPQDVSVDSAGDLFWTQLENGTVDERTAGGTAMVLASGFAPTGVAVDGSGDVFFGSFGAGSNPAGLYEIPSGGSATLVASYFGELQSLAVDGNGEVWGADGAQRLVVVPPGTVGEGVGITGGVNGIRLDAANNLFATTAFGDDAIEVPAGSVDATDLGNIGSYSQGIAVDTSGDVFVGASASSYPYGKVYEIPPGGSPKV